MFLVFVIVFCAIIALGFGAAAAWSDYSRLLIPNMYVVYIGAAFIPAFILTTVLAPDVSFFTTWKSHVLAGLFVFGITYILFYFKMVGGGDSKLLSVYALWVGIPGLAPFLFSMALIGGVLGGITLALKKWKLIKSPIENSWIDKAQKGGQEVPYGIAIFAGAVITFWSNGYLQIGSLVELASTGAGS